MNPASADEAGTIDSHDATPATTRPRNRPDSIETLAAKIPVEMQEAWLPRLYRERILTIRTRSHTLPVPKHRDQVEIQFTLLGVELKVGRRRVLCPDLATARYLAIFARVGCAAVAVPYDITKISLLADEMESAWQRALLLVEHHAKNRSRNVRSRVRSLLVGAMRREIEQAGAGAAIPQFNQNTKQRRPRV
ncbi:MAG: hypothetical protein H0T45_03285 [Pyrinomonadaceae bacterium]|nr:hypothetical protein [Pyrinomonadaceae bacterium]